MEIIPLVIFFGFIENLQASHCDKELNYHDSYGYGYDITCDGLTHQNEKILRNISLSDEIVLNINNSNLTKVTKNLFESVPKLRYLSITNSTFEFDPDEQPFADLEQLEHLTIKNTVFNDLNIHTFQGLHNLRELKLLNASLSIIKNDSLSMLSNLETLKLSHNNFKSLLDIPFCELPTLKYLDLDYNQIQEIEPVFLICFEPEEESDFHINGKNHEIKYQNDGLYHQAKSSLGLIELNLSNNEIKKIGHFDWAPTLKYIDLSNNQLGTVSEDLFSVLSDLEKLNLRNNSIEIVKPKTFTDLKNLKFLNLANNKLEKIFLGNLTNLEEVDLSRNKLGTNDLNLKNLSKLRKLVLHHNLIHNLSSNFFQYFPSLENLDLSNNKIILNENLFANLINLKELDLKSNSLERIPPLIFKNLSNLEFMDLSLNKLEIIENARTFSGLDNLLVLNVSYNRIDDLNYDLFKPLRNLQIFDVSGNRLQNFHISLISLMPSLRVINIKSNLLSCVNLDNIITFLGSKNIGFTVNERLEYDKKNVHGIYCEEMSSRIGSPNNGVHLSSAIGILFLVVISCVVFSFVFYKCLVFSRRRRYMDEIELL